MIKNNKSNIFHLAQQPKKNNKCAKMELELKKIYIMFLKKHFLRVTQERLDILQIVSRMTGYFNVEHLEQAKNSASRATLYRTLELLLQCKIVTKLNLFGDCNYYKFIWKQERMNQLICTMCRGIIEFQSKEMEKLEKEISSQNNFSSNEYQFMIIGTCQECMQQQEPMEKLTMSG